MRAAFTRALVPSLALAAVACASPADRPPEFVVRSTAVVVDTAAPFASSSDFPGRVESTIAAALAYWGGDWSSLDGVTITFAGEAYVPCGATQSLGCFDGDIRVTTADPGTGTFDCVEQTVLVHEIGHAVIGDPMHDDPRWMQLEPLRDALGGREGYRADRRVACDISLSVWRHPRHHR